MVNISRNPLPEKVLNKLFVILFEALGRRRNNEDFMASIHAFLSPKEKIQLVKRIAVMYLLLKGVPPKTITQVLKVSGETVNKYSLVVKKDKAIEQTFARLLRDEQILTAFQTLLDILFPPGTYGTNWSAAWQRRNELARRQETGL